MTQPIIAEVRAHNGRPMIHIDGQPIGFSCYSALSPKFGAMFERALERFAVHRCQVYMLEVPPRAWADGDPDYDFFATAFWDGDRISAEPLHPQCSSLDEGARKILASDPEALILIRSIGWEPASWQRLHTDELTVDEDGVRWKSPSLASQLFNRDLGRAAAAICRHVEGLPWAARHCIGHWVGGRFEGGHEPMVRHCAYDHSPLMVATWRAFLRKRYGDDATLRAAWGDDSVTLANATVPRDPLRGTVIAAERLAWVQAGPAQQARRDYLALQAELARERTRSVAAAVHAELAQLGRRRIQISDTGKVMMQGWSNHAFFDPKVPWPMAPFDLVAGSGNVGVAGWIDLPELDGILTPLDYQWRGLGGVSEPEAAADSVVLRGKLKLAEMDLRTSAGDCPIAPAHNLAEFSAMSWRNFASGLARGYHPYYMDLCLDWFQPEYHSVIARQQQVLKDSAAWPRQDLPGVAMIIDDSSVLDTNGNGWPLTELVGWEWRQGLPRCGAQVRTYGLEDLELPNMPRHRVWYFPNLLRIDERRLELIRRVCCRDGATVVWGPCSGLSDGRSVDPAHATRLTGFTFHHDPVNMPRRCLISAFDHPITRDLPADTWYGGAQSYGPSIYPADGQRLALAWTKLNRAWSGLAVKPMDGWTSVFTAAGPLPSALWRGIARNAGVHLYDDSGEVCIAGRHLVALHSLRPGPKRIALPEPAEVIDVPSGRSLGRLREITWTASPPETRVFRLIP